MTCNMASKGYWDIQGKSLPLLLSWNGIALDLYILYESDIVIETGTIWTSCHGA